MKSFAPKLVGVILCLCLLCTFSPFTVLSADIQTEGDYEYTITDGEATVANYLGNDEHVTVPSTLGGYPVTAVGEDAFANNSTIISVSLPSGITSIQESAFTFCENLSSVQLPDTLISIEMAAFLGCAFSSIAIPDSVTFIGAGAFSSCPNLTEINIPNSVTSMGIGVLADCESLTSATLPSSLTAIEEDTFWGCENLQQINIPDTVVSIKDWAFSECTKLKKLEIPDSVTTIGEYVFARCDGLNIIIPASVTEIDDKAFCNMVWQGGMVHDIDGYVPVPNTKLTLWVYPDTVAQQHAIEHGIPFVTMMDYPADAPGDINADGAVDAEDALLALQQSVKIVSLGDASSIAADVNDDGSIDALDALLILQVSVDLIPSF